MYPSISLTVVSRNGVSIPGPKDFIISYVLLNSIQSRGTGSAFVYNEYVNFLPDYGDYIVSESVSTIWALIDSASSTAMTTNIDDTSDPLNIYIGTAPTGSSDADAVWRIKRIGSVPYTIIKWAEGNMAYDNIWNDRASLTYS